MQRKSRLGGVRLRFVGRLSLALLGCALTQQATASLPASPAVPEAGPPTKTYVLVSNEAWFYQAASAKAERFNLGLAPGAAPSGRMSMGARLELVGERGDFLEVAVPEPGPAHCVDVPPALRNYRMKLFVERAAVLPVVTRDGVVAFPGGSVTVKAGRWADVRDRAVALWRSSRGRAGEDARPIPDELIGTAYTAEPLATSLPGMTYYLGEDAVYYDGWTPENGGGATMEVIAFAPNPGPGHTGDAAVILRERCEERARTVRVVGHPGGPPATALRPASTDNPLFAMLGGAGDEPSDPETAAPPLPKIRAGAQVYWPGGAPAGVTRDTVTPDLEVAARSGRRCFVSFASRTMDETPSVATTPALTFCYRPGDLEAPAP